jgi:hypothetical protein
MMRRWATRHRDSILHAVLVVAFVVVALLPAGAKAATPTTLSPPLIQWGANAGGSAFAPPFQIVVFDSVTGLPCIWGSTSTCGVFPGGGGGSVTITAPSNFTPAQVSVGTSATLIAAARTGRQLLTIVNTTTTAIYLGGSGVTTSTGHLLPGVVGASLTIPYTGAMYGVVASSTATVTEAETY